jgi:acyl carrier protein
MDESVKVIDVVLIRDQIREFIQQNFLFDGDVARLDDDASFLEQGIVDSTGILELVLFCEETYGISVDNADLLPENFDSVRSLSTYVARRLEEAE